MYRFVIALLIAFCFLIGCKRNTVGITTMPVHDTLYVRDTVFVSADTFHFKLRIDSLKDALFIANYKVERVKYYTAIVDRNPSQLRFLKGWIKRAVK